MAGGSLEALVSLRAMERARSTLQDFCSSYFIFHGMDSTRPEHVFRHLPLLMFVESYIYQLDYQNEQLVATEEGSLGDDPFLQLRECLASRGLVTERLKKELEDGVEYWRLEQSLCRALASNSKISISDVMRAMHLKSFDYRVLNILLYKLRNEEVNEAHFAFLTVSEFLVEISDDLFDYEEDVIHNNFNILRLFVNVYGPSQAPAMLAKSICEAEVKYQELEKGLEPELAAAYQRRCEEAVKEGGSKSGCTLGSWTIPPLILDEAAYRKQVKESLA